MATWSGHQGGWSLWLRVHWHRWLSQRQVLRNVRWWLRSCPGLGWAHCSQQTWLNPALQGAVTGSGCGDCGHADSGHRGGGAAPSPCAGRRNHSSEQYCSHCTSHWLFGHSSSSSARHRHQLVAGDILRVRFATSHLHGRARVVELHTCG